MTFPAAASSSRSSADIEEVRRVAQNYISPDRAAIVIVGDAESVTDQVRAYAESIELYDSAGNRH